MEITKTIRVVLTDDHPGVRRGLRRILEKCSDFAVVGESETGARALRLVQELRPDVLMLDIEMPDMRGDQVARELRKIKFPVSILVFSACDDPYFIQEMLQSGADGYLTKDQSPEAIRQAVYKISQIDSNQNLSQTAGNSLAILTKILSNFVNNLPYAF